MIKKYTTRFENGYNIFTDKSYVQWLRKFHPDYLPPGEYIHNIVHQVVQQNERNKCLGPFKQRVPKLLNLINLKMMPNVKEN